MQITKAELKQTVYQIDQYKPDEAPEIAVVGRSNAGKSSLINALCNKKIAKVSQQPGKTRSINAYLINDAFTLMDLPGYGFARRSDQEQNKWRDLIEGYFKQTKTLVHLLLLCDIRHDASVGDHQMVDWLQYYRIPFTIVATKADKIAKSKRGHYLKRLKAQLGDSPALCFSAMDTGYRETLIARIGEILYP